MTTGVQAYGPEDLKLMWRVLERWMRLAPGPSDASFIARHIRNTFPALSPDALSYQLPRANPPFRLRQWGWIVGRELERQKGVIPVVTLSLGPRLDGLVTEAAFRIALLSMRDDNTLHAEGWRFEQGEPTQLSVEGEDVTQSPAHPYAHAQAIIGWDRDPKCLVHEPHEDGEPCDGLDPSEEMALDSERIRAAGATLCLHPAFPLGVTSLTGLALSLVGSLYGAKGTREIVLGDRALESAGGLIGEDISRLGAFS